jgi:hypothetical protein
MTDRKLRSMATQRHFWMQFEPRPLNLKLARMPGIARIQEGNVGLLSFFPPPVSGISRPTVFPSEQLSVL